MGRRVKKPPELKIVLDTSAIFTGSASDLLKAEVVDAIHNNASFPDLTVTWHLPEMVVQERQYQMIRKALELLPAVDKLERLLGHKLNITPEIVKTRVEEAINAQVKSLNISVRPLDTAAVKWDSLMRAAAFREPPFDPGEKEKGFRDAIVAETFGQVLADSPVTPSVCRVALVAVDTLLANTVRQRTREAANVRVLETLDELTGLINTLVAAVDEEFVAQLAPKAQKYFFLPQEETTLYYSQKVDEKLRVKFKAELEALPSGAASRRDTKWVIAAPRFVKKERQRVFWVTRVTIEVTAFAPLKINVPSATAGPVISLKGLGASGQTRSKPSLTDLDFTGWGSSPVLAGSGESGFALSPTLAGSAESPFEMTWLWRSGGQGRVIARGTTIFEIDWSAVVSTARSLKGGRVDGLRFVETLWE